MGSGVFFGERVGLEQMLAKKTPDPVVAVDGRGG
jgi:hypothetical protein